MKRSVVIGVIGKGSHHERDSVPLEQQEIARQVGYLIARANAVTLTGGLGGVMAAAAQGASEAGGLTVGLLPGEQRGDANPFISLAIPTGLGRGRNLLIARTCHAIVMIGGGVGTLNELTAAYAAGTPVVIVSGSGGWADRITEVLIDGAYLDERRLIEISLAVSPAEAVELALRRGQVPTSL